MFVKRYLREFIWCCIG